MALGRTFLPVERTFFERMQVGPIRYCNKMNDYLDNAGRGVDAAASLAELVFHSKRAAGCDPTSASSALKWTGIISSGITATRLPFDVVHLLSGNIFFKTQDDGSWLRVTYYDDGTLYKKDDKPVHQSDGRLVWRHPIDILADLASKTSHFVSTVNFLNAKAYTIKAPSAERLTRAGTIIAGVTTSLYMAQAVKNAVAPDECDEPLSLAKRITGVVGSALDLISWIFDMIANYTNPAVGIGGAMIHAVTGAYWFALDMFSFGPKPAEA